MNTRWSRLAPYALGESRGIAALIGLAMIGIALEALLPWPLKLIVDHVLVAEPLPQAVEWLNAMPAADAPAGMLAWLALAVLLVLLAVQCVRLLKALLETGVASRMRLALGCALFARLHELSLLYHRRSRRGDLLRRVTTDAGCLPSLVLGVTLPVVTSALSLIVLFAIMWQLDSTLALIAILVAVPMGVLMRLVAPRMADRAYAHQEAEGRLWSIAEQTLTALPVVQGFSREIHEKERFSGIADRSVRTYMHALVSEIQFKIGVDACVAAGTALVMVVGGMHVLQGSMSVGTLLVFLSYLTALYAPLVTFVYLASTVAAATGSVRRVMEVLDANDYIKEKRNALPLPLAGRTGAHIRFENVEFRYVPERMVLRATDFEIHPGETIALIGATGAGKSTLVSLIPRLLDPWEGRVLINGRDVRDATIASVREACAFVLQDPFLLPLSVRENIGYARPAANASEIESVARAAGAHEFIERLEHGYDTVIGERGITLSAGQRQRIAIARALLKNAPILIMDEPTSGLDVGTEDFVLTAAHAFMRERTTIIIAHRLSTVRRADRVVVLDHGEIADMGTHENLLASSALYRTLYLAQLSPTGAAPVLDL